MSSTGNRAGKQYEKNCAATRVNSLVPVQVNPAATHLAVGGSDGPDVHLRVGVALLKVLEPDLVPDRVPERHTVPLRDARAEDTDLDLLAGEDFAHEALQAVSGAFEGAGEANVVFAVLA